MFLKEVLRFHEMGLRVIVNRVLLDVAKFPSIGLNYFAFLSVVDEIGRHISNNTKFQ